MRRDAKFAIFIIITAFVVTGLLQSMRSSENSEIVSYLTKLENDLCVFDERYTNEFYSYNSQLKLGQEEGILSDESYVEEQSIIEEFTNADQVKQYLCSDVPDNYISLTNDMRLVTDFYIFDKTPQLQKRDEKARETIVSEEDQKVRMPSNSQSTHIIRANDNLYNLSKKYYKDESKWRMIYEANKNKIPDPHSLQIGQELLIPAITSSDGKNKIILAKHFPDKTKS